MRASLENCMFSAQTTTTTTTHDRSERRRRCCRRDNATWHLNLGGARHARKCPRRRRVVYALYSFVLFSCSRADDDNDQPHDSRRFEMQDAETTFVCALPGDALRARSRTRDSFASETGFLHTHISRALVHNIFCAFCAGAACCACVIVHCTNEYKCAHTHTYTQAHALHSLSIMIYQHFRQTSASA